MLEVPGLDTAWLLRTHARARMEGDRPLARFDDFHGKDLKEPPCQEPDVRWK